MVLAVLVGLVCSSCGSLEARWLPAVNYERDVNELVIYVTDPNCKDSLQPEDVHVEVTESPESVQITATIRDRPACPEIRGPARVVVELDAPVGNRELLDGSRNPPAPPVEDYYTGGTPIASEEVLEEIRAGQ